MPQKFHVYGLIGETKAGWLRGVGPGAECSPRKPGNRPPLGGRSGTPGPSALRHVRFEVRSPVAGRARGRVPGRGAWLGWKKGAVGQGSPSNFHHQPHRPGELGLQGSHLKGRVLGSGEPQPQRAPSALLGARSTSLCMWVLAQPVVGGGPRVGRGWQGLEDGRPGPHMGIGSWPAFCLTLTSLPRPVSP